MTIPFKNIPSDVRTPLFYAELDNSQANTAAASQRTLIIAPALAAGTAAPNYPVKAFGQAKTLAGAGSVLAQMASVYALNDPTGDLWLLPLTDDPDAVAATGSIAFTGTTTATGTLTFYVGACPLNVTAQGLPQPLNVVIAAGQTAAQVATTLAAAVNAATDLAVTAAAANGTVTLTAKNKGAVGNDIGLSVNYGGVLLPGQPTSGSGIPPGVAGVITQMAGGVGNPDLTAALANLADQGFDFIISALNDTTSTAALKSFMSDVGGQWSWSKQLFGHVFYGIRSTQGGAAAWATALNDQHATVLPMQASPTPSWLWNAWMVGLAAPSLRADPGLPLQTLTGPGVLPPQVGARFDITIRNMLLYSGCSTFTVDANSNAALERIITTYVTNAAGQADNSYLKLTTMFLIMYAVRRMRDMVQAKYGRKKLAADGTRPLPNTNVVTPSMIRADVIAEYRAMQAEGFVQGADTFAANVQVVKNATNPDRVDVLWPGIFVDELDVLAMLIQFRQQ